MACVYTYKGKTYTYEEITDKLRKEQGFSDKEMDQILSVEDLFQKIDSMTDITDHSGGAYGADTDWDIIGREFGVKNFIHYRVESKPNVSKRLRALNVTGPIIKLKNADGTPGLLDLGFEQLERIYGKDFREEPNADLKARNYFQVINSDAIFAIAPLNVGRTSVTGGTKAAIDMAKEFKKPIYVWDTFSKKWFSYTGSRFEVCPTPILTKNFAGIGTRDIENYDKKDQNTGKYVPNPKYLGDDVRQAALNAIREVYQKTADALVASKDIPSKVLGIGNKNNQVENLVVIEPDAMRVEFTGDMNNKSKDKEIYEEAAKRAIAALQGKETPNQIYNKLGNKTKTPDIIINPVYQETGIQYAKSINGIFSLQVNNTNNHFGNPFSSVKSEIQKGLIGTKSTRESVEKYIEWVLSDTTTIKPEQHKFIRNYLESGELKGKPIVYYKELGEPSHATALDYLINKYDWNNHGKKKQEEQESPTQKSQENNSFQQFQQSLNKPNTNPILQGGQNYRVALGKELNPEQKFGSQGEPIVKKFEVLDENKKVIGTVTLDIAKDGSITAHPTLTTVGKGYGQELYQVISLKFGAPVIEWGPHNISKSPEGKKLWDSLEKKGLAKAKYQWNDDVYLRGINLSNIQQEQQKKFAELQERLNNKEFLEGAKNAFESSEELQNVYYEALGIEVNNFRLTPNNEKHPEDANTYDIIYNGEKIGIIALFEGKNKIIKGVKLDEKFRNKGLGKKLYKYLNLQANLQGGVLFSDPEQQSDAARRLWNSLINEGVVNKATADEQSLKFNIDYKQQALDAYTDYIARVSLGIIKNPSSGEYNFYNYNSIESYLLKTGKIEKQC